MHHNSSILPVRLGRRINIVWESLVAALVLLVGVPPLLGFGVIFLAVLIEVLGAGKPIAPLTWFFIWALVTGGVLLMGTVITTCRLYAGRSQPHHREYRDFTVVRHARHGPLLYPRRTEIGGLEVVSFGLHYLLSAHAVPAWWPVYMHKEGEDLATYRHPVFLCVLACQPPPFELWSKTHRWDTSIADQIVRGERRDVSPEFRKNFDLFGHRDAGALFADEGLQRLMLGNPGWSIEVRSDRLLAYQIPPREPVGNSGARSSLSEERDVRFVAELAQHIHRAHTRRLPVEISGS